MALVEALVVDYPHEDFFVDLIPDDLKCGLCLSLAVNPFVTVECGHLFCKDCITEALTHSMECPFDRIRLTTSEIHPEIRVQRRILALRVSCERSGDGCLWKGPLQALASHGKQCDFAAVVCQFTKFGCPESLIAADYPRHLEVSKGDHLSLLLDRFGELSERLQLVDHELTIAMRLSDTFVWVVSDIYEIRGSVYSSRFVAGYLTWYVGIDVDPDSQMVGLFLFAHGHTNRCNYDITLHHPDSSKNVVHEVRDWAADYRGKGWGPVALVALPIARADGHLHDGAARFSLKLIGSPFP